MCVHWVGCWLRANLLNYHNLAKDLIFFIFIKGFLPADLHMRFSIFTWVCATIGHAPSKTRLHRVKRVSRCTSQLLWMIAISQLHAACLNSILFSRGSLEKNGNILQGTFINLVIKTQNSGSFPVISLALGF